MQSHRDGARPASRRSTRFPGLVLVAGVVLALTLPLIALFDFQRMTPSPLSQTKNASQDVSVTYQYTASTPTASGLGVRIHYDSTRLTLKLPVPGVGVTNLFDPPGDTGPLFTIGPSDPQNDSGNEDGDASTDKVILLAWAHTGASGGGFPGSIPQNLFTVNFTTSAGFAAATRVNVSAIDTAVGFDFQSQSAVITPPGAATPTPLPPTPTATPNPTPGGDKATIDVDASNSVSPLGDGLMIIKYLFSLRDANLISGGVSGTCTRCTADEIEAYIEFIKLQLDVDGNGSVTPLGDGLMIIKYLFSLRDANLISGGVGAGCTRCTADEIEVYIEDLRTP